MAFEGASTLGVGDLHRSVPVLMFVAGPSDGVAGVAVAEEIDLVEFALAVLVRIGRNAVIDGERDVAVLEEGDDVVHVLERCGAEGDDAGFAGGGNALDEHPVVTVSAGDLDDREVEFHAPIDGLFVERGGHRDAATLTDGLDEGGVVGLGHPGVKNALDVADVGAFPEVLVDESVHVAELEFDSGADVIEAHYSTMFMHNLKSPIEATLVVVRHFQDEEVFEDVAFHGGFVGDSSVVRGREKWRAGRAKSSRGTTNV